ncbi:IS66 family insertion sequence element accessory protein TnpB [Burkholderia ubonensis]|uniref:IS66 family insertion sequence element accessory protein TnpB n=1 Tax=Burkholderia ubonensis TaxID=101571 RepID=UPI0009B4C147
MRIGRASFRAHFGVTFSVITSRPSRSAQPNVPRSQLPCVHGEHRDSVGSDHSILDFCVTHCIPDFQSSRTSGDPLHDLLKCLYWRDGGLCLLAKRLEKGRFARPRANAGVIARMTAQLSLSPMGENLFFTLIPCASPIRCKSAASKGRGHQR